jgi:putative endonuclease
MYYFYILQNNYGKLYCGYTQNVDLRVLKHNQSSGAKYTSKYKNFQLVFKQEFDTKQEALKRESQIKKWSRSKKLALINDKL